MKHVCTCLWVLPAWVLLVASVSFMLDHLVMTNGHRGAYDLHARETDSAQQQWRQSLSQNQPKASDLLHPTTRSLARRQQ